MFTVNDGRKHKLPFLFCLKNDGYMSISKLARFRVSQLLCVCAFVCACLHACARGVHVCVSASVHVCACHAGYSMVGL